MQQYDFEASVGYWITITSHFYQQRLNEALAPYDITFRQFQVLGWLVYDGDLSQADLAERLMVEPPTLVGILDRMQRDGWIERQTSVADRRRRLVKLTEAAEPIWQQVVACLRRMREQATRGMTGDEVATLVTLLHRVQQNLGVEPPEVPEQITAAGLETQP